MNTLPALVLAGILVTLAACQQTSRVVSESPRSMMARVASQAQTCWFKRQDPAFAPYKMATELNSPAGRPRILIVPKNAPQGLPKLVVQAQRVTGITGVATFGPLLDSNAGARIQDDVSKWANGSTSC